MCTLVIPMSGFGGIFRCWDFCFCEISSLRLRSLRNSTTVARAPRTNRVGTAMPMVILERMLRALVPGSIRSWSSARMHPVSLVSSAGHLI